MPPSSKPKAVSSKILFTPRRNPSVISDTSTSSLLSSTAKRYRAAVSAESKPRTKQIAGLTVGPGTPTKKSDGSRPKTPTTPRRNGGDDSLLSVNTSEMDVSRVDPEEALVDFETVEAGDMSAEIDPSMLSESGQDKVLVSVRVKPTSNTVAWDLPSSSSQTIKLNPQYAKSSSTAPPEYHFDEIITGSENKPVYNKVARNHVISAMEGYNSVVFAYGQTASGKTFTLTGDDSQPGIIPRAMKDIFAYIKHTTREYLLRCSYIEIYNETIIDLLAPPSSQPVQIQGSGSNVWLSPLREEVVTNFSSVKKVLERGDANRRTASTDWNERSSRSHSAFRVVIESRERGSGNSSRRDEEGSASGRMTPTGRMTPGLRPQTPGGTKLQSRDGRSVQTSTLSLIDLAGSEKATSDKARTREGKYINTSLLTLGSVISTLADNAARSKNDHVPFRNSKLTRMLQPSLSGDARISVICTINPDVSAVVESTSTLQFAQRIKKVQLNATKKEIVDTEALIERYRNEIEDLKHRLEEKEKDAPALSRRLSAREQMDESKAMKDLNTRIKQLTKLILTSQTVDDASRPGSPVKIDFDMSPYQLQQELLCARREIESQCFQILALENTLRDRPLLPPDAPESEKDKLIMEQGKTIRELEIVVKGYEDNLGEPLRAVREDVENEWQVKLDEEVKKRQEKEAWADELVKQLEKEKKMRIKLENERQALAAFVSKFDALGLGGLGLPSISVSSTSTSIAFNPPKPTPGGANAIFAERQKNRLFVSPLESLKITETNEPGPNLNGNVNVTGSPLGPSTRTKVGDQPSLLEEEWEGVSMHAEDFEAETMVNAAVPVKEKKSSFLKAIGVDVKEVFGMGKENLPAAVSRDRGVA